jgi:hypothetical protein
MRTFNEFVQSKEYAPLAEALVRSGVNVDQFCKRFLTLAEETDWSDEQSINEVWRGLRALFGAGGEAVKQGAQAVGSAADKAISTVGQAGIKAGQAVGSAAMGAGRAVGGAAMDAGRAVGGAAMDAGRAVGGAVQAGAHALTDIYQSAEHQGKVRDTMGKLANMKAQLQKVGIHGQDVDTAFDKFQNELTAALNKLAADRSQRVGPQGVHDARPKLGMA